MSTPPGDLKSPRQSKEKFKEERDEKLKIKEEAELKEEEAGKSLSESTSKKDEEKKDDGLDRTGPQGEWKYGRFYGIYRSGCYLLPIDQEELSRLDLLHKFFEIAQDRALCKYDMTSIEHGTVMDLGTGTGIWANCMLRDNEGLQMISVDLNRIQPREIPLGLRIIEYDLEKPEWSPEMPRDCDLIYTRLLFGGLRTEAWPQFYANVIKHLKGGSGSFEHIEIDWVPEWASEEPKDSATREWANRYLDGMDRAGRSARVDPERVKRQLRDAGFVDITEEKFRCCPAPWDGQSETEDRATRWFNLGITTGLVPMALVPMIEYGDLSQEQVQKLCTRAEDEMCTLANRMWLNMYYWTARKPRSSAPAPRAPLRGVRGPATIPPSRP